MRFDFELQAYLCCSISKMNDPACAIQICIIRPEIIRFENSTTQVDGFWPKIRRLGSSDFSNRNPKSADLGDRILKSKNGMLSKFNVLFTTANRSRTIDELDSDTAV